jgi:hypothetical protein
MKLNASTSWIPYLCADLFAAQIFCLQVTNPESFQAAMLLKNGFHMEDNTAGKLSYAENILF